MPNRNGKWTYEIGALSEYTADFLCNPTYATREEAIKAGYAATLEHNANSDDGDYTFFSIARLRMVTPYVDADDVIEKTNERLMDDGICCNDDWFERPRRDTVCFDATTWDEQEKELAEMQATYDANLKTLQDRLTDTLLKWCAEVGVQHTFYAMEVEEIITLKEVEYGRY